MSKWPYIYAAATLGTAFLAMLWGLRRASVATDEMLSDASEPWRGNRGTHLNADECDLDVWLEMLAQRAVNNPQHAEDTTR